MSVESVSTLTVKFGKSPLFTTRVVILDISGFQSVPSKFMVGTMIFEAVTAIFTYFLASGVLVVGATRINIWQVPVPEALNVGTDVRIWHPVAPAEITE